MNIQASESTVWDDTWMPSVDTSLREPIYLQLYEGLKKNITQGLIPIGTYFPPEKRLHEITKVNHITIRRALSLLEGDGLIERKRRIGTIVCDFKKEKHSTDVLRIGLVVWNQIDVEGEEYYSHYIHSSIGAKALKANCELKTIIHADDQTNLQKRIEEEGVQGVMIMASAKNHQWEEIEKIKVPKLIFEIERQAEGLDNVVIDSYPGFSAGVESLINHGHKDIVFVGGLLNGGRIAQDPTPVLAQDVYYRLNAYRRTLENNGIVYCPNNNLEMTYDQEGAQEVINQLEKRSTMPTAIACFDDEIAYYIYDELNRRGYDIPEEISMLGFGQYKKYSHVNFSTCWVDWEKMSEIAFNRMRERINYDILSGVELKVTSVFVQGMTINKV